MSETSISPPASKKHLASSRSIDLFATPQISAVRCLTYCEAMYGPVGSDRRACSELRSVSVVVLIASHISALITSRTVRAPSRARSMLASIDPGRCASSVRLTSAAALCDASRSSLTFPSIATSPPEPKLTLGIASAVPCSSA